MSDVQQPNYYQEKSYAWSEFMRKTAPKWREFQGKCSELASKLADNKKGDLNTYTPAAKKIIVDYINNITPDYHAYLKRLCTSYALFACQNEGIGPNNVITILQALNKSAPEKKQGEKKGAGKRRGKK